MKPRVFISHSKRDQDFIKRLCSDLQSARIEVWYDDWEIPLGSSLREKIFNDAIPECDLFFAYLSENSINSHWVKRELNAAFILDVERHGGFISLFVDSEATRNQLSIDLRSLRIPAIDETNYSQRILELAASSWEALLKRKVAEAKDTETISKLELEKKIADNELQLSNMRASGIIDFSKVFKELDETIILVDEFCASLKDVFAAISNIVAIGATDGKISSEIKEWIIVLNITYLTYHVRIWESMISQRKDSSPGQESYPSRFL